MSHKSHSHFQGKEAIRHVIEAQAKGKIAAAEIHGAEPPGSMSAGLDAAKETAIVLALCELLFETLLPSTSTLIVLCLFAIAWMFWKAGRSAWLGWSRLERLHRILEQERWEIEHNRSEEREELKALYAAKGLEGQLLEDVMDVLMADGDRLLKVMVEEELGLTFETQEHPLKQAFGAGMGAFIAACLLLGSLAAFSNLGFWSAVAIVIGLSSAWLAKLQNNRLIAAAIWNLGIALLCLCSLYFLLEFFYPKIAL